MLAEELKEVLRDAGAALIGFGDMTGVAECGYPRGVAVAVPVPVHILKEIQDGPTLGYYNAYHELNAKLNHIVTQGAQFLQSQGYDAVAQSTDHIHTDAEHRTPLPHKTVAMRAGLGWIGKSNLLVTPEYGSAVRISALLTTAPLPCAAPVEESQCGGCEACKKACPAQALYGTLWRADMDRDAMFDMWTCRKEQVERMESRLGISSALCGICFVVCPHTKKYISKHKEVT